MFLSGLWQLVGKRPGPSVVVLGGTHGDELTGIEVVKAFLHMFGLQGQLEGTYPTTDLQGDLCLIYGNPEAIARRSRAASGGRDLNRCFVQKELERSAQANDSLDLIRAREIAPWLVRAQFVFDLHATSSDSPPFVCFGRDSAAHRALYQLLPIQYVLTDPADVLSQDEGMPERGTIDAFVERHGGLALGYETGKEDDLGRVQGVKEDVIRLLQAVGSVAPECVIPDLCTRTPFVSAAQRVFALAHSIQARAASFEYAPGMDVGWQALDRGQLIGRYADGSEERAPEEGMLLFPKSPKKILAGKNLYYLARPLV